MAELGQIFNQANNYLNHGQYQQAEGLFRQLIDARPDIPDSWNGLGSALRGLYKLDDSESAYREAVRLQPEGIASSYNLALLLEIMGRFSEAVDTLLSIRAHHPENPDINGELAWALERAGRHDEAIQALEPLLNAGALSVRMAIVYQKLCSKMNACEQAIQYIKHLLSLNTLNIPDQVELHFALGNIYDKNGDYDNAFVEYKSANDLSAGNYSPENYSRSIDEVIHRFSSKNFNQLPEAENDSRTPIFIVGMPRSGTSLVEQILSAHPQVYGADELDVMLRLASEAGVAPGTNRADSADLSELSSGKLYQMAQQYLAHVNDASGGARYVTDKMPHNFQVLGLIRALFPGATIIHCLRDARDTCLSSYFSHFFGSYPYNHDLEHIARHYLDYRRLMQHWKSLGIDMLEVPYERLVADPEPCIRQLIEYCGLEWDECCLNFYDSERVTRTSSYDQVRQPLYTRSIGRWKNYEPHIQNLLKLLSEEKISPA